MMKKKIISVLRVGNKALRIVLPRKMHYRMEHAVRDGISEYIKCNRTYVQPDKAVKYNSIPGRVLHVFLPDKTVHRMRLGALAAARTYRSSGRAFGEHESAVTENQGEAFFKSRVGRDELAEPLAPFIGCDGTRIEPGSAFLHELQRSPTSCQLVLCCAFTGRHRIIEKIVQESLLGNESSGVRWMLTGSTPEDYAFIEALSRRTGQVAGFVVENRPLGRKWQTCMNFATRYFRSELYGITGSDDIVSARLVDFIINRHRDNMRKEKKSAFAPAMYGTLEWLVCHINTQNTLVPQIIKCSYDYESAFEPLGAGRFYTRAFMDECEGLIFESDLERLLDDRGFFEARDRGKPLEYYSVEEGPLISVKGDWAQMNSVAAFLEAPTLTLDEYSFEGHALLKQSLSGSTYKYLFRPSVISPQLNFSNISSGID